MQWFFFTACNNGFCGLLVLMKNIPTKGAGQKDLILQSVLSRSHGLIMPKNASHKKNSPSLPPHESKPITSRTNQAGPSSPSLQ